MLDSVPTTGGGPAAGAERLVAGWQLGLRRLAERAALERAVLAAAAADPTAEDRHPVARTAASIIGTLAATPISRISQLGQLGRTAAGTDWLAEARAFLGATDAHPGDGLPDGTFDVYAAVGWIELLLDRAASVIGDLDRGLRLAVRHRRPDRVAQLGVLRSVTLSRTGSVAAATRVAGDATTAARAANSAELLALALAVTLRPCWLRDGPAAVAGVLAELDRLPRPGAEWHRLVVDVAAAETLLLLGRPGDCLARVLPWLTPEASSNPLATVLCALASLAHLTRQDVTAARHWLTRATDLAGYRTPSGQLGVLADAEAVLLFATRRAGDAVGPARAAVRHYTSTGAVLRAAQARMRLASTLLGDGQLSAAQRELGQACQTLAGHGADWAAAAAARASRRLSARRPRRRGTAGAPALTVREREIAELVTHGLTNRAIAAELYLSPRTVDAHLSRILTKLEVGSRAAVARQLAATEASIPGRTGHD